MSDTADYARNVLDVEIRALTLVRDRLDATSVDRAVEAILACTGHVIVSGVGKPWFIAQKISATMASTGTPSFPLHPNEAVHGDIGRVRAGDVVIALSNSGESEEVVRILPIVKQLGATLIAVTGNPGSSLGKHADIVIDIGRVEEACPLGLAPSASSTALLAVGDALALTVLKRRDFTREDYAKFHPAGALGRKLLRVREIMRALDRTVAVAATTPIRDVLSEITRLRAGAAFVVDGADAARPRALVGVFTDGDLRRHLQADRYHILSEPVGDHMTAGGRRIDGDTLVGEALRLMKQHRIDELPVVDGNANLLGYLDVQDLLDIGLAIE